MKWLFKSGIVLVALQIKVIAQIENQDNCN